MNCASVTACQRISFGKAASSSDADTRHRDLSDDSKQWCCSMVHLCCSRTACCLRCEPAKGLPQSGNRSCRAMGWSTGCRAVKVGKLAGQLASSQHQGLSPSFLLHPDWSAPSDVTANLRRLLCEPTAAALRESKSEFWPAWPPSHCFREDPIVIIVAAAAAAAAAGYPAAADTPDTTLTLWREMVHPFAPAMCKPVGGYAAGPRRREVTALGAGQGSGLLLLLLLQENVCKAPAAGQAPTAAAAWRHR